MPPCLLLSSNALRKRNVSRVVPTRKLRFFVDEESDLFVVFVIVALVPDVNGCRVVREVSSLHSIWPVWSRLGLSFFLIWRNPQKDIGHVDAALSTSTSSSAVGIEGGVSITAWHGSCHKRNSQGCMYEM